MGTSSKELAKKLHQLARRQHGCFTASQAIETGYADSVHLYHVKNGEWTRLFRGIYRLTVAPESPESRCMAALLWTRDKNGEIQGFLSDETVSALRSETLTTTSPIHLGVPKSFRRSSDVPESLLITFFDNKTHKTSKIGGFPVLEALEESPKGIPAPPKGMDAPDYYDWLDYQAVVCPKNA